MTTYRVYWNSGTEHPYVWSVDEGDISTEQKFKDVIMPEPIRIIFYKHMTAPAGSPKGWIEVLGATLVHDRTDDTAYIFPTDEAP